MLFDRLRHEPLTGAAWSAQGARAAVDAIVADSIASFDLQALWPPHPLDEPEDAAQPFAMLYEGAGGVIWALQWLREQGLADFGLDFDPTIASLPARNRALTEAWGHGTASYLMGESGLLLLAFQNTRDPAVADALHAVVEGNLHHPAREALWGSPGSMLAALHMHEMTDDERWATLFRTAADVLWDEMEYAREIDAWLWTQDLYGQRTRYLGAPHGFAGNVYPMLRGAALLPAERQQAFAERAVRTLQATALREDGLANWQPVYDASGLLQSKLLVQDCHGAPGIVCRFASCLSPELDTLLLEAGELTWRAGPLTKGAGLCHGTAGNGYAFLKLHRRNGNALWLERARAFATHAIAQVERHRAQYRRGRYSLWTGDLGVAMYLAACLDGSADLPTLDRF